MRREPDSSDVSCNFSAISVSSSDFALTFGSRVGYLTALSLLTSLKMRDDQGTLILSQEVMKTVS